MIKTVLSIEDDQMTQLLNRITLEDAGFCEQIIEANNGKEALLLFEQIEKGSKGNTEMPDVILLDLNMPIMGGWEFYDNFNSMFHKVICKTKIFILSSSLNPEDKNRASKEEYITNFLEKPLDSNSLSIIANSFR